MDCKHSQVYKNKGVVYCQNCGVIIPKVTIYRTSEFFGSVTRCEAYLIEHGRRKYAQYDNAPFAIFIVKGKRNFSHTISGYKPYLLILEGWDTPQTPGLYGEAVEKENGVIIRQSKYACFDEGFRNDFDAIIDEAFKAGKIKILADYRAKCVEV